MTTKNHAAPANTRRKKKYKKSSKVEPPNTSGRIMSNEASTRTALYKTNIPEKVLKANSSSEVDLPPTRRIPRRTTHRMITEIPLHAALDTTEILENVLSLLAPFSLFSLQRVCRQWRDLIARSPSIKEKMFLRMCTKTPEIWTLISPEPLRKFRWDSVNFPEFVGRRFRNASVTEVESGNCNPSFGRTLNLFTPVS